MILYQESITNRINLILLLDLQEFPDFRFSQVQPVPSRTAFELEVAEIKFLYVQSRRETLNKQQNHARRSHQL